jgi:hypothetical protein
LTEHEKLGLEMPESGFVTGDLVKYEQTGELWKSTYPRDVEAYKELAPIRVPSSDATRSWHCGVSQDTGASATISSVLASTSIQAKDRLFYGKHPTRIDLELF